jgi:hypothetical protein
MGWRLSLTILVEDTRKENPEPEPYWSRHTFYNRSLTILVETRLPALTPALSLTILVEDTRKENPEPDPYWSRLFSITGA